MGRQRKQTLGERLRTARRERDLSLRDIEREYGINSGYLSQLERDQVANPTLSVLRKVAAAYGEPLDVLMEWAGYIERDPTGVSPNKQRALNYIPDDISEAELAALKAVLDAMRGRRSATFAGVHRTDLVLPPEDRTVIRAHAIAVLRELDAERSSDPVDLDAVMQLAKLVEVGAIDLTLEQKRRLRRRFGSLVDWVLSKLHGVVHLDAGEVFVNADLHEMRRRFVLGHEAGHAILEDHRLVFAHLDDKTRLAPDFSDLLERQANQFSIDLLAKGDRLRAEFDGSPPNMSRLVGLCRQSQLSLQAGARRIAEETRQELAIAIAWRAFQGDGQLMDHRHKVWCSKRFEERFGWAVRGRPDDAIRAVLRAAAAGAPPVPIPLSDAVGDFVELGVQPKDARYAVLAMLVPPPRPGRVRPLSGLFR